MLAASSARAEGDSPLASIRVDVQMVSISPAAALSLVPALSDEKTIEEANARLQKMIARDEATLLGWPVLWLQSEKLPVSMTADGLSLAPSLAAPVQSGSRSLSMTAEECRYPTEFDPPQGNGWLARSKPVRPVWGAIVPTVFEIRDLGCHLETQAEVDADGGTISLSLDLSFIRLLGFDRYRKQTSPLGIKGELPVPGFFRSAAKNWIRVRNGRLALLNVFVVPKPEPHVELFLVRAKATLLDAAKSTPLKK